MQGGYGISMIEGCWEQITQTSFDIADFTLGKEEGLHSFLKFFQELIMMILTYPCREAKKYKLLLSSLTGLQTCKLQGIEENIVSGPASCHEEASNYHSYNAVVDCFLLRARKKQKIYCNSESKLIL